MADARILSESQVPVRTQHSLISRWIKIFVSPSPEHSLRVGVFTEAQVVRAFIVVISSGADSDLKLQWMVQLYFIVYIHVTILFKIQLRGDLSSTKNTVLVATVFIHTFIKTTKQLCSTELAKLFFNLLSLLVALPCRSHSTAPVHFHILQQCPCLHSLAVALLTTTRPDTQFG